MAFPAKRPPTTEKEKQLREDLSRAALVRESLLLRHPSVRMLAQLHHPRSLSCGRTAVRDLGGSLIPSTASGARDIRGS